MAPLRPLRQFFSLLRRAIERVTQKALLRPPAQMASLLQEPTLVAALIRFGFFATGVAYSGGPLGTHCTGVPVLNTCKSGDLATPRHAALRDVPTQAQSDKSYFAHLLSIFAWFLTADWRWQNHLSRLRHAHKEYITYTRPL